MTSFIYQVLNDLKSKGFNLSEVSFILPSRRAGVFLKKELSTLVQKNIFSPEIISIESFVEELADLKSISNTELLFEFYTVYTKITPVTEQEPFDSFTKWAQLIIQDFNEIDRYLIPQKNIFEYLSAIKDLDHWSLEANQTPLISNYLKFWNKLYVYYQKFTSHLKLKNSGYQGLIYREAVNNLENYIQNTRKKHVFLGFNALNTCEETIIQELLQNELAYTYWDIDKSFVDRKYHDAGLFIRQHLKTWKYFKNNKLNWLENLYETKKNITVFGVPKNVGQAKTVGTILEELSKDQIKNTAVILGDENLLLPVLNSIPKKIEAINITMGFPLKSIPLASLFEQLFSLQINYQSKYYYKDIIAIINHQYTALLFDPSNVKKITNTINTNNLIYLTKEELIDTIENDKNIISLLFTDWNNNVDNAIEICFKLISVIKDKLVEDRKANQLSLEYLYRFNTLFNEISSLNQKFKTLNSISGLYSVYKELLSSETLDFQGEPLQGLQVMGMLESRVIDFETVIITNVNEGVLPSGKSNNSFIPFDVKIEKNLPTYKEKDAVYTYHFYHLLQRAKNIYILYNTETDALIGGEKSRFINQLELEGIHDINHKIIAPKINVKPEKLLTVPKTKSLIEAIKNVALKGFSPSSLTNYVRNPIDFYNQKILGINTLDEVEENVAANTLGTVVHNTLEALYIPLKGHILTQEHIKGLFPKIDEYINKFFKEEYKEGLINQGKNLIVYEVAKRYITNFLNFELEQIKKGNKIQIIDLEKKIENVYINIDQLDFPIKLNGTVDRIDVCNGKTRIIDYKTGKVEQKDVTVVNWEDLTTDYKKYSKSFQVLMYAYMLTKKTELNFPVEAGIISFKNLKSGFIKFAKKEKSGTSNKDVDITEDTLTEFEIELKKLIIEICNPEIPFTEKEIKNDY